MTAILHYAPIALLWALVMVVLCAFNHGASLATQEAIAAEAGEG